MSELDAEKNVSDSDHSGTPTSAGTMLRLAREAQGLHIAMLAVSLKVSVKKLEALEADQYDLLPDLVFVRGLASSVCRHLKIDEQPVLAALPRAEAPKINASDDDVRPRFQEASLASHRSFRRTLKGPWGIALVVVLTGIASIVLWPKKAPTDNLLAAPTSGAPMSYLTFDNPAVLQSPSSAASTPSFASPATSVAGESGSVAAPAGMQPAAGSAATSPIVAASVPLKLEATGNSWIAVMDADSAVVLERTLVDGENIVLTGKLPFSVVLGRADVVRVWVRGQVLDTRPYTKNSVARFEVN